MSDKLRTAPILTAFTTLVGQDGSLRAHLVRGALGSGGLKISNVLLGLGLAMVLARSLGPEGYGIYAFTLSVIGLLSIPVEVGLPTLVVREIAKYNLKQEWGLVRGLLRRANQIVMITSILLVVVAASFIWTFGGQIHNLQIPTFAWALALIPLTAIGNLRGAALQGLRHVVQGQLSEMLLRPGILLLLACGAILVGTLSPSATMALNVVAAATALYIGNALLKRVLPSETRVVTPSYDTAAWTRSILPLSLLVGIYSINNQTDILMLGLLSSPEEVGVFRVAAQGATLVAFISTAGNVVIAPNISHLYHAGESAQLQRMVTWSARLSLLAAIPVAAVMFLFGRQILTLVFGADYADAYIPLCILCLGQLVHVGMGPVGLLLNMTGNEWETAKAVAISAVANLVFCILLIPSFGIAGAAMATTIAAIIWKAILNRRVSRLLRISSTAIGFNSANAKRSDVDVTRE